MSGLEHSENTYIVDSEHADELVRLVAQDQTMNEVIRAKQSLKILKILNKNIHSSTSTPLSRQGN